LGSYSEVSEVDGDVLLNGSFTEVNESGAPVENGIFTEESSFLTQVIKSEEIKKSLTGLKPDDKVTININEAFPNQADIASMLKTDKKNLDEISSFFEFRIAKISKWQSAEINQDLFDKAYGENQVKSEKEFEEKIAEDLTKNLEQDSNYKFSVDAKKKLLEKIEFNLPDEFLKRFILLTDKKHGITPENIEEHYSKYQEQFKWELIKNKIIADNNIQITEEEVIDYAIKMVRSQFINYGINYLPDEYLVKYCDDMLKKEDERTKIQMNIYEDKTIEFVKGQVKLTNKKVSLDEFNKLFEKK
jgi:trigger factor